MKIILGGATIEVRKVFLYKSKEVNRIAASRGKAIKLLGPGGAVVGVAGAPSWTLAAEATALSLVTGFLASAAAKEGAELLRKVKSETELMLANDGLAFDIDRITNISLPYPAAWEAINDGENYTHSGEDFVWIMTDFGRAIIRWSAVGAIHPEG